MVTFALSPSCWSAVRGMSGDGGENRVTCLRETGRKVAIKRLIKKRVDGWSEGEGADEEKRPPALV